MLFWIICLALTLIVGGLVAAPMLRRADGQGGTDDRAIYHAQMAQVDTDLARGVLNEEDATRARTEIARRLLAAKGTATGPGATGRNRPDLAVAGIATALLAVVALGLYASIGAPGYPDFGLKTRIANGDIARAARPDQAALEAAQPALDPVAASDEHLANVARLRALVPTRPDDLQGWALLSVHEADLRNYGAAARAQARVVELLGDAATSADRTRLADLMVAATGGWVSPEAETVARAVLDTDPGNIAARYYLGAMYDQTDRPDIAFALWRDIVEQGNPMQMHVAFARAQIEATAARAGQDYALAEVRGPTADDVAAAQELSPEDQQAMIANMVAGLADRLAREGGPPSDWARLITAYGVLGETETAANILAEARQVFAASPDAMQMLDAAAAQAGLPE